MSVLAYSLPVAMAGMAALYWLQRRRGDAGVVDVGWAGGIGLVAVAAAYSGDGWEPRRLLLGLMGAAWSFRLTAYLVIDRIVRAKEEDGRYQMLRAQWGAKAQGHFFYLFQAQALLVVLFGLPFVSVAAKAHVGWTAWDIAGVLVWTVAVVGERIADHQQANVRSPAANPRRTSDPGRGGY
ncbi:MAG: DUF1295 domain-containing protein [Gemmatimonadetes bacterium]|nr:DUF1295 domain-containing protein [Gemmatimonadota bacterium]